MCRKLIVCTWPQIPKTSNFDFFLIFIYNISIKERERKINTLSPFTEIDIERLVQRIRKSTLKFEKLRKFLYNISVKSKGRKSKLPFEKIKLKKLGGGHRQKEEQYDTERIL
jgi:hypothetical protein